MSDDRSLSTYPAWMRQSKMSGQAAPANHEFNFFDLWKVLRRRRNLMLATVAVIFTLGIAYTFLTPRLYKAEAQLQVLKQDAAAGLSDPAQSSASAAADALDFNLAVQTQVSILRSRTMALRVIHELKLDETRDYQLRNDAAEEGNALEASPRRLAFVLARFDKRLHADSVAGTRLISITFLDRSPERAAQVVNQLLADFIDYNYQVRFAASTQATGVLRNELQNMKAQVDQSQANAVRLQQSSGIYGIDETHNSTNAKLEQLNAQLTVAQANLAVKRSVNQLAMTRSPEILSGLIGPVGTGANSTNEPLQLLRQQQAEAAANYAELNAHYGSEYPKVLQAGKRLQAIQASIQNETNRLVGQAAAEYKVAADTESSASRALQLQKGLASQMNHDSIVYTSAKHEADTSRDLYEELVKRLKEAGVLSTLHSTNLNVLDAAVPPAKPAQPLILMYLLLALLAGILAGVIAVFTVEGVDGTVRDPQRIEDALGVPVLALIPPVERSLPKSAVRSLTRSTSGSKWQYQTTAKAPRSIVAEAFRMLRTAILSSLPGTRSKVLAITSTSESEGKSFTTFNLASAFAQSGRSVLVIDADLRKRTLTVALGLDEREGLDEAVAAPGWQKYVSTYEEIPGLFILPAGQHAHYPSDVLGSVAMSDLLTQFRKTFDLILIDTPSILPVTDAVSLSSAVDGVILVAKCGATAQHSLSRTLNVLRRAGANVFGVVLNGIDFNSADFYYYWGKQSSGYAASPAQILAPATKAIARSAAVFMFLVTFTALIAPNRANAQGSTPTLNTERIVLPPPAPVSPQSVLIGAGDLLAISVYDAPELTQDLRVGSNGTIHITLLGDVQAGGLQPDQLAGSIEAQLSARNLIRTPHASVTIKEFTTQGVTVEGEVKKPGLYPVYTVRSLVDVLALADGTTSSADVHITIRRHDSKRVDHVTLQQDDGDQVASSDVRIYPGDTVIVPRAGMAYVLGDVARPGGYMMRDNGSMTVLQAISEAQGTTRNASLKRVLLLRKSGDTTETIPIQLKAIQRGQQPDQHLTNGDILFVPTNGLKSFGESTAAIMASISGAALYAVAH